MLLFQSEEPSRGAEGEGTHELVEAIAFELWALFSRRGTLDWNGAERYLERITEQARGDARDLASHAQAADMTALFPL